MMPIVEPDNKVFCTLCRTMKSRDEFYNNRSRKNGKQTACKTCSLERTKRWRNKSPSERNVRQKKHEGLRRLYGMTIGEYEHLEQKQKGVCAACKGTMDGHRLVVDHNHETGAIRGLLCRNCNAALGLLKDDPVRIRGLLYYIYRTEKRKLHAAG